jgi:hypothetical protein
VRLNRAMSFFWGPADPRTYALVRIAFAGAALANLIELWPQRYEYLAGDGTIVLDGLRRATQGKLYASVFYAIPSHAGVTAVFVCAAVALVALGLGMFSRVAAFAAFVWHLSYSNRALPVLHGWDAILRCYSLLLLVSPLGRAWSLDGRLRPRPSDGNTVPIYGLRMMQWQLFVLYLTTLWLKLPDPFWRNGQTLAYFSISQYARAPNDLFLVHHEWISAIGTYASLAAEAAIPWLLWMRHTRWLGFVAGLWLHAGIAFTAKLGVFSSCMIAPYLSFLERADVDWLVALTKVRSARELRATLIPSATRSGAD